MKSKLVIRSVYPNILILLVTMTISGCIPFPFVEYPDAKPGTIQVGSTSKAKIFK